LFRVLSPLAERVGAMLGRVWSVGSFNISAGDVLAFVITLGIAVMASRFIRFVLQEDVLPRIELPRGVPGAISTVAHYVILAIGFVFAVGAAGIDLSQFALLAGAFGVGIGFGLQSIVNNFVSGLVLIFERPIQIGDTIEVGSLLGRVRRIGIRSSTVRTYDGAEVIVPNGNLISAEVVNWTLSDRHRRIELAIGVAYGTDPNQVLEILRTVTPKQAGVLENPQLQALFDGFGDSSLDFSVRFWTDEFENFRVVSSNVNVAIHDALKEAGITIPFPQRDLHLRSVDASVKRALSNEGTTKTGAGDE
jgi:small-conductance mechanosensitive channel